MRLPHQRRLAIYELFFTRAGLCKQTWEENIHTDSVHDTEQPLLSGRSVKSRQHVQRHITRRTQAKIVFRSRYFYSLSFHLSGILADSRQPGMMLFFCCLNRCSSCSGRNLKPVLVRRGIRTPSGGKKKIYGWNVSALFHISLIRQNKKAITLGQKNTGHGLLTFYHGRHILTGALKVVTHSSAWGRLIELPAATKWGLHPLRVEMNCNLFRPCCSQETKWVWAGEGGVGGESGGGAEGEADRERGLEPQRISNKFTEGERREKKKSKREESNENKAGARRRVYCALFAIWDHSSTASFPHQKPNPLPLPCHRGASAEPRLLTSRPDAESNVKFKHKKTLLQVCCFVCWYIVIPCTAENVKNSKPRALSPLSDLRRH